MQTPVSEMAGPASRGRRCRRSEDPACHFQQLLAEAFGFLLNRGWSVKIDAGVYWEPKPAEVSQI